MKTWLYALVICLSLQSTATARYILPEDMPDEATYQQMRTIYDHLFKELGFDKSEIKDRYAPFPPRTEVELDGNDVWCSADGKAWEAFGLKVDAPLKFSFYHQPFRLGGISNSALEKFLKEKPERKQVVPTLTVDRAIAVAKDYFKKVGYEIPANYKISEANFNRYYPSCWEVHWMPYAGEYPIDQFLHTHEEDNVVVFHETLGLMQLGTNQVGSPLPKSMEVKFSRDDAIAKAAAAVPLLQRSPFYLQARRPGFVAKTLKEAQIVYVGPNWLLDPARAIWIETRPPKETRLAWMVRFTTVNTRQAPDAAAGLVPPDMVFYLDAASGEIIGASFS